MIDVGTVIQVAQAAGQLLPVVIAGVDALVKAGQMSPEDAEIVKHDIQSRRAEYLRAKAEDERALALKHGAPDELVDVQPATGALVDPWSEPDSPPPNPYEKA